MMANEAIHTLFFFWDLGPCITFCVAVLGRDMDSFILWLMGHFSLTFSKNIFWMSLRHKFIGMTPGSPPPPPPIALPGGILFFMNARAKGGSYR